MDTAIIIQTILASYALPQRGTHGVTHWARVMENGLRVAEVTGANLQVVTLFALFHDACRENEHRDHGHGLRGAELAQSFRGTLIRLNDSEFDLLYEACRLHTDGETEGDITVQTCWDADRLDLMRVGIQPIQCRLCTDAGRALLLWANQRASDWYEPEIVAGVWRL
jgi:uncharacterized protein